MSTAGVAQPRDEVAHAGRAWFRGPRRRPAPGTTGGLTGGVRCGRWAVRQRGDATCSVRQEALSPLHAPAPAQPGRDIPAAASRALDRGRPGRQRDHGGVARGGRGRTSPPAFGAGAVREVVQSAPAVMPESSGAAGAAGAMGDGPAPGGLAHERLLPGCWSRPASPSSLRRRVRVASRSGPSRSSIQRLVSCACRRPRAARSCPAGVRAISCRRRLPGSVLLVIRSRARSRSRRG